MTREQHIELIERAKTGDEEVLEYLLHINSGLVYGAARKLQWQWSGGGDEIEDLANFGYYGLYSGIMGFDSNRGSVVGYLRKCIWNEIYKNLGKPDEFSLKLIYLPSDVPKIINILSNLREELLKNDLEEVTNERLAQLYLDYQKRLKYPKKSRAYLLELLSNNSVEVLSSLDESKGADDKRTLTDITEDSMAVQPDEQIPILSKEEAELLFNQLDDLERFIIKLRMGFIDGQDHPVREVAELIESDFGTKMTRANVHLIETQAIEKLRILAKKCLGLEIPEYLMVPNGSRHHRERTFE